MPKSQKKNIEKNNKNINRKINKNSKGDFVNKSQANSNKKGKVTEYLVVKKVAPRKVIYSRRLNFFLFCFVLAFLSIIGGLIFRIFVQGEELKKHAFDQQLVNKIINPARGSILDRNGEVLAQSIPVDTISINLEYLKKKNGEEIDKEKFAVNTASILEIDVKEVREKLNSESKFETIAKYVDVEKVRKYKKFLEENSINSGVNFDQDNKRVYPYGKLASQLIGFCGTDNIGLEGLERTYNDILSGRAGKITSIADVNRRFTSEMPTQLIKEENGKNIYLTIDIQIQGTVEKYLKEAAEKSKVDYGIVVAMNPKTGEILAMANYPTFDLNTPFAPVNATEEEWKKLTTEEKNNRYQDVWKNKAVANPYEPGSVFKLVTAAIGLELDVVEPKTKGDFFCASYQKVDDVRINCWSRVPHGALSLHDAIVNSCNPSMIQLGQRIGQENYKKYMRAFGFFNKSGSGISGEALGIFFDDDHFNNVELATLSFGQRFTVNPLQVTNAISSIVNGGKLYKPSIISKVENPIKGTVNHIEPQIVRRVISEEHSNAIKEMMKDTTEIGTGKRGKVEGYSTGSKTGTSEPPPNNLEEGYTASYISAAPIKDPEIVILGILKNPKTGSHEGSVIAAPMIKNILQDVLPSLKKTNVLDLKNETVFEIDNNKVVEVENVEGKTLYDARSILQKQGLKIDSGDINNSNEMKIKLQIPKPGEKVFENSIIYLETERSNIEKTKVPDLIGLSMREAISKIDDAHLNYMISKNNVGKVTKQSIPKDTEVESGRIIELTIE